MFVSHAHKKWGSKKIIQPFKGHLHHAIIYWWWILLGTWILSSLIPIPNEKSERRLQSAFAFHLKSLCKTRILESN